MHEKVPTAISYATSGTMFVAGLSINEWLAAGGFVLAVATFGVNWHYKAKHYRLAIKQGRKPVKI